MGALLGLAATLRIGLEKESLSADASDGFSSANAFFFPENNEGDVASSPDSNELIASTAAARDNSALLVLSGDCSVAIL